MTVARRPRSLVLALLICLSAGLLPGSRPAGAQTNDAPAVFHRALQLFQAGDAVDALSVIDSALEGGASDPALYNLKGLVAGELGLNAEAEKSFRTVIRLAPQAAMGYNNLGVLLTRLGRPEEAARAFHEAHSREPENFNALLGLGTSLAALRKYGEAATYLEKAWNLRPGDFQAGYEWAHVLLEAKRPAEAGKVLSRVSAPADPVSAGKYYALAGVTAESADNFAEAARAYRKAYELDPTSYATYLALVRSTLSAEGASARTQFPPPPSNLNASENLALGLIFAGHEDFDQAIPWFEAALRLDPSNEVAILNLALAEKSLGKTGEAIDRLRKAMNDHPSAALSDALAGMEEESGQYLQAVASYQRAVELDPSKEQYYFDLGVEYLTHFTFGPASEVYRVGTQKFPESSRQFLGLGFSHYVVREYREAADAFTRALEIDPDSPAAFRAWKSILDSLPPNDWGPFLPRLDKLARTHPRNAELAFCHGAALFRSEVAKGPGASFNQAQVLLEKSVRLRPNFPPAHLELGALYTAKKERQRAVDEYLEAIREDDKSEVPHYRLGQLYREMNKLDAASAELSRYQQLYRARQEKLKHTRSTIQQFIVPEPSQGKN